MKIKTFVKFICFIVIIGIIFSYVQSVFIPKSNTGVTLAQFYNEPKNSIDVLMIGGSGIRSSVLPPVLWDEAGIASYNLAMSGTNQAAQYYVFNEALRYQSPALVLVHGVFLFSNVYFDSDEARFRQVLDNMRWSNNKIDSVKDILANSEQQTFLDYLLPLLRYHDRNDLNQVDFSSLYKKQRNLYMAAWRDLETTYTPQTRPEMRNSNASITVGGEYLKKIIDTCRANNIEVAIVNAVSLRQNRWEIDGHETLQEFADMNGIKLIDFNTYELYDTVGLDASIDFFDNNHTNIIGGTKVSRYLARYLAETFMLPDRRIRPHDSHWDNVVEHYERRYNRLLSRLPGSNIEAIVGEIDIDFDIEMLAEDE